MVAVDTSAYGSAFPRVGSLEDPRWGKVVRDVLAGRDVKVPEAMLKELAVKSGVSREEALRQLASLGRGAEALPEASAAVRMAIKEAGSKSVSIWDRRIAASAADLRELFATGDFQQARALFRSGLMSREQIISLRPTGVIPGHGWDPGMLAVLAALGLGGAAATSDHGAPAVVTPDYQ